MNMFCPNCGKSTDGNFCTACGTRLVQAMSPYPPLDQPYPQVINGKQIDLNKLVRTYGTGWRKSGAYAYLISNFGISLSEAKAILDPLFAAHAGQSISYWDSLGAQLGMQADEQRQEKQRIQELENSGVAYCPKCLSTSVEAKSRGFSLGRAAAGSLINPLTGLAAGVSGSKKTRCVCLKCGHTWKP